MKVADEVADEVVVAAGVVVAAEEEKESFAGWVSEVEVQPYVGLHGCFPKEEHQRKGWDHPRLEVVGCGTSSLYAFLFF